MAGNDRSKALRITAKFPTKLKLRLRVLSSIQTASRLQRLRFSTPPQWPPSTKATALGHQATDVVADVFIGFSSAGAFAVDGDDAARMREGGLHGVGGFDQHRTLFDASVPLLGRAVAGRFFGEGFLDRGE